MITTEPAVWAQRGGRYKFLTGVGGTKLARKGRGLQDPLSQCFIFTQRMFHGLPAAPGMEYGGQEGPGGLALTELVKEARP